MSKKIISTVYPVKGEYHTGTIFRGTDGNVMYQDEKGGKRFNAQMFRKVRDELTEMIDFMKSMSDKNDEDMCDEPKPRLAHAFVTDEEWSGMDDDQRQTWRDSAIKFLLHIRDDLTVNYLHAFTDVTLRQYESDAWKWVSGRGWPYPLLSEEEWSQMSTLEYKEWRKNASDFIMAHVPELYQDVQLESFRPIELRTVEENVYRKVYGDAERS